VTVDELHGLGVSTSEADFLIQDMYGFDGNGAGLWQGNTLRQEATVGSQKKYAFLRMDRNQLHPAHIAFHLDQTLTNSPLTVARILLNPYYTATTTTITNDNSANFPDENIVSQTWTSTLALQWARDSAIAQSLYPQLLVKNNKQQQAQHMNSNNNDDLWSCPLRAAAFWGAARPEFSPLVPNPLLADALYGLGGAHPLISIHSAAYALGEYLTSNGACFYQSPSSTSTPLADIIRIDVNDAQNPCGLQNMLKMLQEQAHTLSRVLNHFTDRCNQIIDTPDLGSPLRSGETLKPAAKNINNNNNNKNEKCGVLHRLTPFLLRTKGDAGEIAAVPSGGTTSTEGGDCHMGRSLIYPLSMRSFIAGRQCALIQVFFYF